LDYAGSDEKTKVSEGDWRSHLGSRPWIADVSLHQIRWSGRRAATLLAGSAARASD